MRRRIQVGECARHHPGESAGAPPHLATVTPPATDVTAPDCKFEKVWIYIRPDAKKITFEGAEWDMVDVINQKRINPKYLTVPHVFPDTVEATSDLSKATKDVDVASLASIAFSKKWGPFESEEDLQFFRRGSNLLVVRPPATGGYLPATGSDQPATGGEQRNTGGERRNTDAGETTARHGRRNTSKG